MRIKDIQSKFKKENPSAQSDLNRDLGFQIGKRIELARAFKNVTQAELAQMIGTRQSSISRVESGSSLPSLSFLQKIAEAFNTYIIPPDFAFMKQIHQRNVDYRAESSDTKNTDLVLSPYYAQAEVKRDSIILG